MASQSSSQLQVNQSHFTPYCSDPECESCSQLRETQEAIRLHKPLLRKGE